MITGKKHIADWFAATKKPYWALYEYNKVDSGKRRAVSSETDGITHLEAAKELDQCLNRLAYGKYTLVAVDKPGNLPTRGFLLEDFEISPYESGAAATSSPAIAGVPEGYVKADMVHTMISDALAKHISEQETKRLKEENAQLKKDLRAAEQQDGLSRLAGIAADIFPHVKDKLMPQLASIGNIPQPLPVKQTPMPNEAETIDLTDEQQERVSTALGAFAEAAPEEWIEILESMAAKVKSNPGIIKTLKAFL